MNEINPKLLTALILWSCRGERSSAPASRWGLRWWTKLHSVRQLQQNRKEALKSMFIYPLRTRLHSFTTVEYPHVHCGMEAAGLLLKPRLLLSVWWWWHRWVSSLWTVHPFLQNASLLVGFPSQLSSNNKPAVLTMAAINIPSHPLIFFQV